MKNSEKNNLKKLYNKPVLKAVKIRPKEVLGSGCHNSVNPAPFGECDLEGCAY